jgi:hypothetical protein
MTNFCGQFRYITTTVKTMLKTFTETGNRNGAICSIHHTVQYKENVTKHIITCEETLNFDEIYCKNLCVCVCVCANKLEMTIVIQITAL